MKLYPNFKRYITVLTNGVDDVEVIGKRHGCYIDLRVGQKYSFLNGQEYLNDKPAWFEIKEDKTWNWGED